MGSDQGRAPSGGSQDKPVIRTPDRRLRVFVSSTLGEMAEERLEVSRAISALRLTPVMFEVGARPYPPIEVYRAYLAQSDVFIGLYWEKYGQLVPGTRISGLEEEFELSGGLPRLLYVKEPAPNREPGLAHLLARIENESPVSYRSFRTSAELGSLARDDLAVLLSERFVGAAASDLAEASSPVRPAARLPVSTTSLLGRERAIDEVAGLVESPGVRMVTLTGPGGIGKTRLAVAVGEQLQNRFGEGTVVVPLDVVTDPAQVLAAIGRAVGAAIGPAGSHSAALAETFGDGCWLLILDGMERVVQAAAGLGELLTRCPNLAMLVTSRTVLGLRAEREYPVPPLPPPPDPNTASLAELESSPAVALFVNRAHAVRPDFALSQTNAAAVAEICRRLDGVPLAIELAAARIRLLDPQALLDRLAASLDALGTGAVDLPERQRTLRTTVEWSMGLLDDPERSMVEVMAAFIGGCTMPAAAAVADLAEDRALELCEGLARHSLIYVDSTELGPRSRMLETVREFAAQRLAARPDADDIRRRHARYYRALSESADRPLRHAGLSECMDRLQADGGNVVGAVRWHLTYDPMPLPHLLRALWLFWTQQSLQREAQSWVEQLLPTANELDSQAGADLAWAAAALAVDIGDDGAASAARERLAPLVTEIRDPFLHAACRLAIAWTLPIGGDIEGALREVSVALDEFRALDEPVFTAMATFTAGALETALDRYDDALPHLSEARHLADICKNDWLEACSRVMLGVLDALRGSPDEARLLLDEALDLSLAAHSAQIVTMCLAGYAHLALGDGQPDQAATLEGAAEGLRRRMGLPLWPQLQPVKDQLIAKIRQRLGHGHFDRSFSAGSALSLREAVSIVRDQRGADIATS